MVYSSSTGTRNEQLLIHISKGSTYTDTLTSSRLPTAGLTHKEGFIELEVTGALSEQLIDTVQPLEEDRTTRVRVLSHMTTAV